MSKLMGLNSSGVLFPLWSQENGRNEVFNLKCNMKESHQCVKVVMLTGEKNMKNTLLTAKSRFESVVRDLI